MILVVDDNEDTALALKKLLRKRGYDADILFRGDEALSYIRDNRPSLIILDQMMPGMTGLDVLRKLRADPTTRNIPVLFYSAGYDSLARTEASRLGAIDWITKGGYEWDGLLKAIMGYLPKNHDPADGVGLS